MGGGFVFRIEIIIRAIKLAEIVKNKSRERRGEEWSRKERRGEVRSLDKLWFKRQKKKKKNLSAHDVAGTVTYMITCNPYNNPMR